MWLIVGLNNPGPRYANTRGFRCLRGMLTGGRGLQIRSREFPLGRGEAAPFTPHASSIDKLQRTS